MNSILASFLDYLNMPIKKGSELERLGRYLEAWKLLHASSLDKGITSLQEWDNEPINSIHLVVEQRIRHVGYVLRMSRILRLAAHSAISVTCLVEDRLIPILQRSYPTVKFQSVNNPNSNEWNHLYRATSLAKLAILFAASSDEIINNFSPLYAEKKLTEYFRTRYKTQGNLLIGCAWHSTNNSKELPNLDYWANFISQIKGDVVSLQYFGNKYGAKKLSLMAKKEIKGVGDVDQFIDIDSFAAQIQAMDLVVTISNTTAHLAGSLGVSCIVILDDKKQLTWPYGLSRSPFYPSITLIRKMGRSWSNVFEDILNMSFR